MAFKSILNPSQSVAIGIGLGAVDAFIFSSHLPNAADVRTANPGNNDVDATRRQAVGLCIAINGLASVMTRDWNVFLIGGIVTVGLAFFYVHANAVDPSTGKMVEPGNAKAVPEQDNANAYTMPDYGYSSGSEAA
jgi:hypothetical protein